jgi:hypothetical protein
MTKIRNSKRPSSSQANPVYGLEVRTYQFLKNQNNQLPMSAGTFWSLIIVF